MKFLLENTQNTPEANLLIWIQRFLRYKSTTLSNRLVKDKETIITCLQELKQEALVLHQIQEVIKKLRNNGLSGINTYAIPLFKFFDFCKKTSLKSLKDIDEEFVIDFLNLQTADLSYQTKKNYRMSLLLFFDYLDKNNQDLYANSYHFGFTLKINSIQNHSNKLPDYLNKQELESFIIALQDYFNNTNPSYKRDAVILTIIAYTGIRVSEALMLELRDITKENGFYLLNIKGKGNKSRFAMIKEEVLQDRLNYWLEIRKIFKPKNNYLFCNQEGRALSQPYIYRVIEKILKNTGILKRKMGTHLLRHSFATLLYQKHKDLVLVQEALGHADVNTSRIYTHFDYSNLILAANAF